MRKSKESVLSAHLPGDYDEGGELQRSKSCIETSMSRREE